MWGYNITINRNVCNVIEMCSILFGYAAQLSDYLWQLSICFCMSQFMACISSISDLYMSTMYFILLMVVSCAAHANFNFEAENSLSHYFI